MHVTGPGGLFDINATLPLVALQFVLLMVILNILLYSPLLTIIDTGRSIAFVLLVMVLIVL